MIGGMLERLEGANGGGGGEAGREAATNKGGGGVPPTPSPLAPPPPPPPSPSPSPLPVGPSITHYDETTGVPLAREAVASQQALGHTVVPLGEAYSRRLSRLQVRPLPWCELDAFTYTLVENIFPPQLSLPFSICTAALRLFVPHLNLLVCCHSSADRCCQPSLWLPRAWHRAG